MDFDTSLCIEGIRDLSNPFFSFRIITIPRFTIIPCGVSIPHTHIYTAYIHIHIRMENIKRAAHRKSSRGEEARTKRGKCPRKSWNPRGNNHAVSPVRWVNIFYLLTEDISCRGAGFYTPRIGIYVSPPCLSVWYMNYERGKEWYRSWSKDEEDGGPLVCLALRYMFFWQWERKAQRGERNMFT